MNGAAVVAWMRQNQVPPLGPGERITGAVTVDVTARDHVNAASVAAAHFVDDTRSSHTQRTHAY